MATALDEWIRDELRLGQHDPRLAVVAPAADILLSRAVAAAQRGATDPLVTVTSKRAGGNSRACTKRMLEQLGLEPEARRVVHRLLAGSPSGWPGLLRIFSEQRHLSDAERTHARRQLGLLNG
ncbi:hypothetical protein [Phycicoccus sp. Soil803]|uniref:hypothetical protein n=1 Tax=Phycicoccus sp. Soil803 TaxID=1736415 RepID=UPI000A512CB5|nr:hypothetical protein [Phycicoccus sp. Soil803]